jgi:hypothetical protein
LKVARKKGNIIGWVCGSGGEHLLSIGLEFNPQHFTKREQRKETNKMKKITYRGMKIND